jgi:hypothetical protein
VTAMTRTPTRRDLRIFGALLPVFFGVLGALVGDRTGAPLVGRTLWGAGGVLTTVFWAAPAWRRPIYRGWIRATYPLGWVMTHVVLTVVFVAVITPVALLLRVLRIDPLARRLDPGAASYWVPRAPERDPKAYLRQY